MKLLLISPSDVSKFSYGQPKAYSDNMAVFPPLSLLSLVSYIKFKQKHYVEVFDMAILHSTLEDLKKKILASEPDVVGITCTINRWYSVVQILRYIKDNFPHIKTVTGGYNTSEFPAETLSHDCVDYMVLGTGQLALHGLLDCLESGDSDVSWVRGLFARKGSKRDFSSEKQRLNPDLFPLPDRECVPYQRYSSAISRRFPSTVMISSDGCPFKCAFCNTCNMGNVIMRSPDKVVDEMADCVRLGIKEIMFQDELFTLKKERVIRICEEIVKRKLDVIWNFKSRVNLIDEDMLPGLKKAGCTSIHFGIENGNDRILELMNKGITTSQAREVIALLNKHKIDASASFMLAYPGETIEEMHNTIKFARELDLSYVQFTVTSDFPGTKIYLDNLKDGKYSEDIWKKFVLAPTPDFEPPFSSDSFEKKQLNDILNYAYRKFYLRLGYVKKRVLSINSPAQFLNQLKIAKDMFFNRW